MNHYHHHQLGSHFNFHEGTLELTSNGPIWYHVVGKGPFDWLNTVKLDGFHKLQQPVMILAICYVLLISKEAIVGKSVEGSWLLSLPVVVFEIDAHNFFYKKPRIWARNESFLKSPDFDF